MLIWTLLGKSLLPNTCLVRRISEMLSSCAKRGYGGHRHQFFKWVQPSAVEDKRGDDIVLDLKEHLALASQEDEAPKP